MSGRARSRRRHAGTAPAAGLIVLVTAIVFAACSSSGGGETRATTTTKPQDVVMRDQDFPALADMTKVGNYFVANELGHLQEALAVARSPEGGRFPVGTLLQLVPQEAMVKRRAGFSPRTRDWEFFFLDTSSTGTRIVRRGTMDVVNRFGGNCASCHLGAEPRFDMICQHDHGCAPLPVGEDVIAAVQQADPRPR
jgi:hypothetical protein